MAFDSLGLLSALALFAACIGAWLLSAPLPARARLYLRFSAMLFAGLAVSFPLGLSGAVVLFLLPLAAAALMIASLAPLPVFAACVVLILGLGFGLTALLSAMVVLALAPAVAAGLVIIAASLNRGDMLAALAGAALSIGALASWNENALAGVFLFCAASLLGLARAAENQLLRSSNNALRGQNRLP